MEQSEQPHCCGKLQWKSKSQIFRQYNDRCTGRQPVFRCQVTVKIRQTSRPAVQDSVWLSATGSKYHLIPNCGRMNPNTARKVSLSDARSWGYEACRNCYRWPFQSETGLLLSRNPVFSFCALCISALCYSMLCSFCTLFFLYFIISMLCVYQLSLPYFEVLLFTADHPLYTLFPSVL